MWGNHIFPPSREQHSAAIIGHDLYIFGGKARVFPTTVDIVLNDLWKVNIPHSQFYSFNYSTNNVLNVIPQNISKSGRIFATIQGNDITSNNPELANDGLCVEKVIIKVKFIYLFKIILI